MVLNDCCKHTQAYVRGLHFSPALAERLEVAAVLKGHAGCVNRLAWNEEGDVLVSGSDDKQVCVPLPPDKHRAKPGELGRGQEPHCNGLQACL